MRRKNKKIAVKFLNIHLQHRYPEILALAECCHRIFGLIPTLAAMGIDAARISTVSYGKERPEALGSTEADWARNRRAVTVTVQ